MVNRFSIFLVINTNCYLKTCQIAWYDVMRMVALNLVDSSEEVNNTDLILPFILLALAFTEIVY